MNTAPKILFFNVLTSCVFQSFDPTVQRGRTQYLGELAMTPVTEYTIRTALPYRLTRDKRGGIYRKGYMLSQKTRVLFFVLPAVITACGSGSDQARQILLEKKVEFGPIQFVDHASAGNLTVTKLFLGAGMSPNAGDVNGFTALIGSAFGGHTDIVTLLLSSGADVNAKEKVHGITALMGAASVGQAKIVRLLVERNADVNAKDRTGETALMKAAMKGYTDIVALLVTQTSDINMKEDTDGLTALMGAAYSGHK